MSVLELLGSILTELEKVQEKLDRLLASKSNPILGDGIPADARFPAEPMKTTRTHSPGFEDYIPPPVLSNFALPKTGEYQWYRLKGGDKAKLRRCRNEGCNMFLKYNGDKKSYEHWKYDANTGVGGYVQDKCDHYFPEGS